MRKLIVLAVVMEFALVALGQQEPHYTMFMFNKQMINPAYAGSREAFSINALYRKQWVTMEGAPESINLGIHTPLRPDDESRVALGLLAFNDQIGVTNQFGLYAQYAYRIPVGETTKLSLGLQGGFNTFTSHFSELKPRDGFNGDVSIMEDIQGAFLPNFGFGAHLYHDRYYVGFSIPRLLQNQYDKDAIASGNEDVARQLRHYFLMGGVVLPITADLALRPNVILKYVYNQSKNITVPFDADLNLSVLFYNRFLVGVSYRLDDSFDAMLEMQVTKNLRMGYAYDFTTTELNQYNDGTHEIMIGYDFSKAIQAYTTPRFIKNF